MSDTEIPKSSEKFQETLHPPKSLEKNPILIADNFSGPYSQDFFEALPPNLDIWANVYLKSQIEGVKTLQTFRAIRNDLQKFMDFFRDYHKNLDIRKWLPRTTQRFVEHLQEINQKPQTIKRAVFSIRALGRWVFGLRKDLFPLGEPTKGVKTPTQEALRPKGLDDRQVKRLLDAAYHLICQCYPDEKVTETNGTKEAWYRKAHLKMRRPFRDNAILMLLLNGGLRRAEVCELNRNQFQEKHLKDVKCKGNIFRDILLGDETIQALQSYLKNERENDAKAFPGSEALFLPSKSRKHRNTNGRLSPRLINVIVEHIANVANQGLPNEEQIKLHPHMLRHTHAYQILKKGRSLPYLQKRLGHQSMNYLALYAQMPEIEEKELLDNAEFK